MVKIIFQYSLEHLLQWRHGWYYSVAASRTGTGRARPRMRNKCKIRVAILAADRFKSVKSVKSKGSMLMFRDLERMKTDVKDVIGYSI